MSRKSGSPLAHDALTRLAGSGAFLQVFAAELLRSARTARQFAILLMDLDRIKRINDRHEHLEGRRAFCRFASVSIPTCRSTDPAARYANKLRRVRHAKERAAQPTDQHPVSDFMGPERRRSERLLLDVTLIVSGESTNKQPFQEETFTISISAHGALLMLAANVALGQTIFLKNPQTADQTAGRVARLGAPYGGMSQVAVEFPRPVPDFWRLDSPPDSWRSR